MVRWQTVVTSDSTIAITSMTVRLLPSGFRQEITPLNPPRANGSIRSNFGDFRHSSCRGESPNRHMPTRITEIDAAIHARPTPKSGRNGAFDVTREMTLLKVEGTLHLNDAELLEKICRQISTENGRPIVLELSELCFLDSDG